MVELTDEQLKLLKTKLLEIMDEFDRVCRKNDIEYSLGFGTMLGAIRHKGFIPWDDDMDVIMDRPNFDKFSRVCETELRKPFEFVSITNNKLYGITFAPRLMNSATLMVETCRYNEKWHNGIFLDIFVYDRVSDNRREMIKNRKKIDLYSILLTIKNKGLVLERKKWSPIRAMKILAASTLSLLPSSFFSNKIEKYKTKYAKANTMYMSANMYGVDDDRDLLKSASFENYIEVPFEGRSYLCIKDYDYFLRKMYGEYLTPPHKMREFLITLLQK